MHAYKQELKKNIRKSLFALTICIFVYISSYILNSFFGGYWLVPERDGKDKYSFGMSMTDAILWQPRLGHEAWGNFDFCGWFYTPIIQFDRKFIHPTMYLGDKTFEKISNLKVSQVHPHWRDEFLTKIKVTAIEDETNKILRCFFNYTGSDYPREVIEIRIKRSLADSLAVSAPNGFSENTNKHLDHFFMTNYIYWTGKLPLEKNKNVSLQFPIQNFKDSTGNIVFYYQRSDNAVDSRNICSVELK